jgi:hypothetical protein
MGVISWRRSMRLDNATGPDTGGTYSGSLVGPVDNGPNSLKIGVPPPLRDVMSMAHVVAKQWTFPANITACCHDDLLRGLPKNAEL